MIFAVAEKGKTMRLIDADRFKIWLMENYILYDGNRSLKDIDEQPTVDAVPVVRCKDCKWFATYPYGIHDCIKINEICSPEWEVCNDPDDYCSRGERKE